MNLESIILLGSGNIAHTFGHRLKEVGVKIVQVYGRSNKSVADLATELEAEPCNSPDEILTDADVYLIAVSDDAIAEVSEGMPKVNGLVIHTSGSTPLSILPQKKTGVIWPVRSMKAGQKVDWEDIDLIYESEVEEVKELAEKMGSRVKQLTAEQRRSAHLIAVILNNFTNHLLYMADDICDEAGINRRLFDTLLDETIEGAKYADPAQLQTGPAVRGDQDIIGKQLELLKYRPDFQTVYRALSLSIITTENVKKL